MGALGINANWPDHSGDRFRRYRSAADVAVVQTACFGCSTNAPSESRESLEASERAREEAAKSQEEMQQQLEESRAEGQQLIAQARDVADRFREEELAKAREEISAQRSRAEADIQRERDAAVEDIRREFAGLAVTAAERVVRRSLDDDGHEELIEQVLREGSQANNRN